MPIWRFRIIAKAAFIPANFVHNFRRNCRHSIRTTNTKKKSKRRSKWKCIFSLRFAYASLDNSIAKSHVYFDGPTTHNLRSYVVLFSLPSFFVCFSRWSRYATFHIHMWLCVCVCVMCVRLYGSRRHLLDENVLIKHKCTSLSTRFSGAIFGI